MKRHMYISLVLLLSGFSQPYDGSRVDSECTAQLKGCFALSDSSRDLCFKKTSQDDACAGSSQGSLAAKRAAFSPMNSDDGDDAFPTPDASIINRQCVQNFDNLWLSNIVNGSLSQETVGSLNALLDSCTRSLPNEMMRP